MNSTNRKKELKALYKKWPDVRRFLKTLGCSTADAEDIFQEAMVLYCRKCEEKDFQLEVNSFHYVKGICKFLWYNQSRKKAT
jgi:DNA-directed RNA polymerase specialized sigma24 family protein